MTRVKLSYFDFAGGRGEDCRLALHLAGVDFEDDRVNPKDWSAKKPSTPFGAMPVLEIEGQGVVAQSNAILGLIGSQHDLLPKNAFEAAKHIALLNAAEDLRARVAPTMGLDDKEKQKKLREELADGYLKDWAKLVDSQIDGPFAGGDVISVADLKLFVLMNWFKNGVVEHVPTTCFDDFAKLSALHAAVADHPKVVAWYQRR